MIKVNMEGSLKKRGGGLNCMAQSHSEGSLNWLSKPMIFFSSFWGVPALGILGQEGRKLLSCRSCILLCLGALR